MGRQGLCSAVFGAACHTVVLFWRTTAFAGLGGGGSMEGKRAPHSPLPSAVLGQSLLHPGLWILTKGCKPSGAVSKVIRGFGIQQEELWQSL